MVDVEPTKGRSIVTYAEIVQITTVHRGTFSQRAIAFTLMKRVLLLDCENDTLKVTDQNAVREAKEAGEAIQECFIPPKSKEIAIFVDARTQTKVTTSSDYHGGTVLLTKIYLDRLGTLNTLVRSFGGLSSIYVTNVNFLSNSHDVGHES